MKFSRIGVVLASALLSVAVCNCGGGGGSTTRSLTWLFDGTYSHVGFGSGASHEDGLAWWGTATADGLGAVTAASLRQNSGGDLSNRVLVPHSYSIHADRRMLWALGTEYASGGGIAADGRCAVLGSFAEGRAPSLVCFLSGEGTFDAMSLVGDYHLVAYGFDSASQRTWARVGKVSFNGTGGAACVATEHRVGGAAPWNAPDGTYTVAGDGTVDLSLQSENIRGAVLAGGEVAVLGGGTSPGSEPVIYVLLRGSSSASTASLNGPYHAVDLVNSSGLGGTGNSSWAMTAVSDGQGTLTFELGGLRNDDGVTSETSGSSTQPYAVVADGTLDVADGTCRGGVSSTGAFAACAGVYGGGFSTQVEFVLLVR